MAPHHLRILVCLCLFLFIFSFFYLFFATFSFIFSRDVPFGLFYSFLALSLIFMDLFLCFDIYKQFCYLAKCFDNTCKTYKYAKVKTLKFQTAYVIKENLITSVGEPDMTF